MQKMPTKSSNAPERDAGENVCGCRAVHRHHGHDDDYEYWLLDAKSYFFFLETNFTIRYISAPVAITPIIPAMPTERRSFPIPATP